jgi:hypothetical protein
VGCEAGLALSGFNRTTSQASGLVEPAEQKTGATQRLIGPAAMTHDSPGNMKLEEPLTLSHPAPCLASLADLR